MLFKMTKLLIYVLVILCSCYPLCFAIREYKKEDILKLREEVREMFQHAYDSYLRYAYPYDELRPLSCDGIDTWGSYSLTLIDALDTLVIMGNYTEFNRVVNIVTQRKDFDADINVSVFETNIRIIGGLLSAHLLQHKAGMELEPGWPCNGPLLRLAEDVAQRLIAAFDTTTGMPYGTINLRSGVPPGETSVTCTAAVGTFIVEFGTLSRLTGDPLYEEVAYNALKVLYHHKSPIGLHGNHIDVMTGRWTAQDAGIGGGVDSYYEYLVKGAILFQKPELMSMFHEARAVIDKYLKKDDWYVWASMARGHVTVPVFQSLESYWPGLLALIGDTDTAMRIILNYHGVWKQYGFTPEIYNLGTGEASPSRESYPLRPELIESIMYLYRETRDPILLQMGEDILRSIQHSARTPCGYATIQDVRDHRQADRMESFFLSETTKYLYLLFDPDNFIHNPGTHGTVIDTPNGECIVDVGGYIFNTEAHPIDPSMLYCCHQAGQGIDISEFHRIDKILDEEDNIKFMSMLEASSNNTSNETTKPAVPEPSHTKTKTKDIKLEVNNNSKENKPKAEENKTSREENTNTRDNNETKEKDADTKENDVSIKENTSNEENSSHYHSLIKTETRTDYDYDGIDGADRDKNRNESSIREVVKERISSYFTEKDEVKTKQKDDIIVWSDDAETAPDVESVKLPEKQAESIQPPSSTRAQKFLNMLPGKLQDLINKDWTETPKCEPQHLLEKIRKNNKYPDHPDKDKYELLLSPAPSFLQRISLAGEFLNKNQLDV